MSKRHQASRRRAYGRRQHEIHERTTRREEPADFAFGDGPWETVEQQQARADLAFGGRFLGLGE
ncbi:MAG TPA: hypothetical protein VFS32_09485 [Candidatus Limnocylindrales bacterium]|nr:hypothetical protein [Candidatus Limnocylindrales bacterium]